MTASQLTIFFSDVPGSNCGSWPAGDGGLIGGEILAGVHIHSCGNDCYGFRPYGESLLKSRNAGPVKSNPNALAPPPGTSPRLGVPSLRHCSAGRRDGPARLNRHPCRFSRCAIPAFGQRGLTGRLRSKSKAKRGGLPADLTLEACAFPCGSRASSRWTLTMTQCHWKNVAM